MTHPFERGKRTKEQQEAYEAVRVGGSPVGFEKLSCETCGDKAAYLDNPSPHVWNAFCSMDCKERYESPGYVYFVATQSPEWPEDFSEKATFVKVDQETINHPVYREICITAPQIRELRQYGEVVTFEGIKIKYIPE